MSGSDPPWLALDDVERCYTTSQVRAMCAELRPPRTRSRHDVTDGGPGFGQLRLALLNEILAMHGSAPVIFGTQGPDTGNMEILAAYGTPEQKERWLYPLMNQEIWSAFSMTEPQGGSDPSLFQTTAVRDGTEWVINGEKWFTSFGQQADIILVMCQNCIIAMCKTACADAQKDIVFRAIHIMGSLGVTHLTPLQEMWSGVPTQFIMDGPDEVHKVTIAKSVLRGYEPHAGNWPTDFLPAKRDRAKQKFATLLSDDAELAESVARLERWQYDTIS